MATVTPTTLAAASLCKTERRTSGSSTTSFSNFGFSSVDISAPGVVILSTVTGNTYADYNGTSMATSHAAGTAALAASANPELLANPTSLKD